jgi:hypothetical protein
MADEPLTNPPATLDQVQQESADRARAAIGGAPMPRRRESSAESEHRRAAEGVWSGQARMHQSAAVRAARFQAPEEVEFEFNPPASPRIPNSNIPLTIGLLFSIVASFIVFFAGLGSNGPYEDPILPAFWRALGALAVLSTLSFAASWFMPEPVDRRQLLDRMDAEDRALGRGRGRDPSPVVRTAFKEISPIDDDQMMEDDEFVQDDDMAVDKGGSVDMTLDDDFGGGDFDDEFGGSDELEELRLEEEDDFYGGAQSDFATTSPSLSGESSVPAAGATE